MQFKKITDAAVVGNGLNPPFPTLHHLVIFTNCYHCLYNLNRMGTLSDLHYGAMSVVVRMANGKQVLKLSQTDNLISVEMGSDTFEHFEISIAEIE